MSLLSSDRLYIVIGHGQISFCKLKGRIRPRLLAQRDVAIDASLISAPWEVLCAKIGEVLADPEWQAAEADIVLSNRLVRHAVIPFNAKLKKYPELEAFARHVLGRIYGAAAGQWELRIHRQGRTAPSIACAVDRALLEYLRQTLAGQKVELRSVTSHLMQVYNHQRRTLQAQPAWMVVPEQGHVQLALLSGNHIAGVHGLNHDGLQDLPMLLDRENLMTALAEPCKTVYVALQQEEVLPVTADARYELVRLEHTGANEAVKLPGLPSFRKGLARIVLDFQKLAFQPSRNAGWMLLAAGLALVVEMGISYDRLRNDRASMEREITASNLKLDDDDSGKYAARYGEKDIEAARQIFKRLTTPWEAFFTGLESVNNKYVAILSVVPDMQTGMLRVEGEAKNNASLLTLVQQLRTTKPFYDVYLSSQQVRRDNPLHPVDFVIYMHWMKRP